MECSESAFLRKGALFVYFCKTGSLLGYKNSGQGGYFGYKVRIETQKAALINKQNNAKFARMPFVFTMYRMGVKKHMAKNFPPEGWKTEWVRCDGKEIHFNLHSCLYHDICVEKGCPELCRVYCENDNIAFSGLMPWERSAKAQSAAIFILSM